MTWMKTFLSRFLALFKRKKLEEELEEEIRFHLEMEAAENVRRGMAPDEAGYAARRSFGGVSQSMEAWRDRRWLPQVDQWTQDLRLALRNLGRSPGFTLFAMLSLALGIGVNTAIYTLIRVLVVLPLPYPEPWSLVKVWESMTVHGELAYGSVSPPNLRDWREQNQVFEDLAAFTVEGANLMTAGAANRLLAAQVEPGVFPILRIDALKGRTFLKEEGVDGNDRVVLLSHRLWQESFASDPGIVGTTLSVNGADHVVVGVMPQGFQFPPRSAAELWTPLVFREAWQQDRGSHWVQVIARLKPGVSWLTAAQALNGIARRLQVQYPITNATRGVHIEPLHPATVRETARLLLVLAGAVGVVLLLACANVAHLMLARAAGRQRELGVRIALGSGRWRIVRMLTMESIVLAALGGAAGYFAGRWCLDALLALAGDQTPPDIRVVWDSSTILVCIAVSAFSAIVAGLVPAVRVSAVDPHSALKDAGSSTGTALGRSRNMLMVWEVALALILAIGALLLTRSLRLLNSFDIGFRAERVLSLRISLPDTRYTGSEQTSQFYDRLLERLRGVPGVHSAGLINFLPVQFCCANSTFQIEGHGDPPPGHEPVAEIRFISPGYLETLNIPVLSGRNIGVEDRTLGGGVALLSRTAAERYFAREDPIGRSLRFGKKDEEGERLRVVGIVGDVRDRGVYRRASAVVYRPFYQTQWPWRSMSVVLRSSVDPDSLAQAIRGVVREQDPEAAVFLVKTMDRVVSESVARTRLLSRLLSLFSALALVLAVVGVYGVMSHLVSQRTHEIGVRMALGASRTAVMRLVLERGLRDASAGVLVGLACTIILSFAMRHFLIGLRVIDFSTYLGAAVGIIAVALVASCVPAWRAARVDPLCALRDE